MEQEFPYNETLVSRRGNSCAMPEGTDCATPMELFVQP